MNRWKGPRVHNTWCKNQASQSCSSNDIKVRSICTQIMCIRDGVSWKFRLCLVVFNHYLFGSILDDNHESSQVVRWSIQLVDLKTPYLVQLGFLLLPMFKPRVVVMVEGPQSHHLGSKVLGKPLLNARFSPILVNACFAVKLDIIEEDVWKGPMRSVRTVNTSWLTGQSWLIDWLNNT